MDHAIGEMHAVGGVRLRWDACACNLQDMACFHRTDSISTKPGYSALDNESQLKD